jgi:outer membrane protein assembly factor BamB
VYASAESKQTIHAVSAATGTCKWVYEEVMSEVTAMTVDEGVVYFANGAADQIQYGGYYDM